MILFGPTEGIQEFSNFFLQSLHGCVNAMQSCSVVSRVLDMPYFTVQKILQQILKKKKKKMTSFTSLILFIMHIECFRCITVPTSRIFFSNFYIYIFSFLNVKLINWVISSSNLISLEPIEGIFHPSDVCKLCLAHLVLMYIYYGKCFYFQLQAKINNSSQIGLGISHRLREGMFASLNLHLFTVCFNCVKVFYFYPVNV